MRLALTAFAVLVLAACSSSSQPAFTLAGASVDPTYYCPGGANNAPYELHATVHARNSTAKQVSIEAVTAQMTVASIKGVWLERVGDRYEAANAKFTPTAIPPGTDATLRLTIPSACTSGKYGTGTSSSADYTVLIRISTSAGNFTVTAGNQHEIVAD